MNSLYKFYLKLIVRRLPIMALLFLVCACAGVALALKLPTTYKTGAKLLVVSAQIPDALAQSTVDLNASEQLEIIEQRLMTRRNLIDIANKFQVFPRSAGLSPDEIVREMRRQTSIRRASGRDRATLMTLSFTGEDPSKIVAVVNEYITIILAENTDIRTSRADDTLAFFEQEVNALAENLSLQSQKIVEFKSANAEALPENLDYRLGQQTFLQERLSRAERDLQTLIEQRASVERIYEATGNVQDTAAAQLSPDELQLQAYKRELRQALTVFSDKNPKVVNLKNQIAALEEELEAQKVAALPVSEDGDADQTPPLTSLDITLSDIDIRMSALNSEIGEINGQLEVLEASIKRTPVNGITLDAMIRERENTQSLYDAAVRNRSQAQRGSRIESSTKGERITVLEPPNVPDAPASPNRPLVAAMGVAAGLGLAAGYFLLLELFNQAIRRPDDIRKSIGVTPLATIPRIESVFQRRTRRVALICAFAIVVTGVPAGLWAIDQYYLPLDLLFEKVKDRLI